MDVIIMPSTISLIQQLKIDYPQFKFKKSSNFSWSHSDSTIYYANTDDDLAYLFHELSHAILNHIDYNRDIELLAMEAKTWDKATEIAIKYNIQIDDDMVQSTLDTYRDWLHKRSTCPKCTATGVQTKKQAYKCLACGHQWQVNESKTCALRRYKIKI
jgi:hypothetical protein